MGGRLIVEKVDRNGSNSDSGKRNEDVYGGCNHVWFEIWLLTKEAIGRGNLLRESFDSTALSKTGSEGRNSFKIISAPGSTDDKLLDDTAIINSEFAENGATPEFKAQAQLRSTKSMSIAKPNRNNKSYKSTIRKKRRATLTSTAAAAATTSSGGDESNEKEAVSNSGAVKNTNNTKSATNAATNFFRKGSIMLASGLARASTISHGSNYNEKSSHSPLAASFSQHSMNEDTLSKNEDKNIAVGVQMESQENTFPPIISYYSGGNTNAPPPVQEFNNLLSESAKSDSVKSKNSSLSVTNINTSRNISMPPHSAPASFSSSTSTNLRQLPLHITIPNNRPPLTPPLSSYAGRPPSLTLITENNNNKPPSSDKSAGAQVTTIAAAVAAAAAAASSESPKQLKILLVEDNLVCQRVTCKMLSRNNYLVDIANHGKEAVDMVEIIQHQQQYACILMDIITPVMNGYEATQVLRERGVDIPIIALTANSFESDVKKAMDVGMNDFLTKPIKEAVCIFSKRRYVE